VARLVVRLGDRQVLSSWVRSTSIRAGLAQRARIVLLAADGVVETPRWRRFDRPTSPGHPLYDPGAELYDSLMATMNISHARDHLPDAIKTARTEAVFVQRRGRPAGVLVSPERYEQLMAALEDAEDVAAFDEAIAEEGPNIPWEQVKADLGWQ